MGIYLLPEVEQRSNTGDLFNIELSLKLSVLREASCQTSIVPSILQVTSPSNNFIRKNLILPPSYLPNKDFSWTSSFQINPFLPSEVRIACNSWIFLRFPQLQSLLPSFCSGTQVPSSLCLVNYHSATCFRFPHLLKCYSLLSLFQFFIAYISFQKTYVI